MGACVDKNTGGGNQQDNDVDTKLRQDYERERQIRKLLLLGPGESGKSTIFKQAVMQHAEGWSEEYRLSIIDSVKKNIAKGMSALIDYAESELGQEIGIEGKIDDPRNTEEEFIRDCKKAWSHPAIQAAWDDRSKIQISEFFIHFLNKLDEVYSENYVPSDRDILYARRRTTGIISKEFVISDQKMRIVDVGGQRSERRKWVKCFDNVDAVLFVIESSGYDQQVFEDKQTNRLTEAFNLFEEMASNKVFYSTNFILFLNKDDLLKQKLKRVKVNDFFPSYKGDNSHESVLKFLKVEFKKRFRGDERRVLYIHNTCATDSEKSKLIFKFIKDTLLRKGPPKSSCRTVNSHSGNRSKTS